MSEEIKNVTTEESEGKEVVTFAHEYEREFGRFDVKPECEWEPLGEPSEEGFEPLPLIEALTKAMGDELHPDDLNDGDMEIGNAIQIAFGGLYTCKDEEDVTWFQTKGFVIGLDDEVMLKYFGQMGTQEGVYALTEAIKRIVAAIY